MSIGPVSSTLICRICDIPDDGVTWLPRCLFTIRDGQCLRIFGFCPVSRLFMDRFGRGRRFRTVSTRWNWIHRKLVLGDVSEISVFAPYLCWVRTDFDASWWFGTVSTGERWIEWKLVMGDVSEKSVSASSCVYLWTISVGSRRFGIGSMRRSWIDRKLVTGDAFESSVFALYRY